MALRWYRMVPGDTHDRERQRGEHEMPSYVRGPCEKARARVQQGIFHPRGGQEMPLDPHQPGQHASPARRTAWHTRPD